MAKCKNCGSGKCKSGGCGGKCGDTPDVPPDVCPGAPGSCSTPDGPCYPNTSGGNDRGPCGTKAERMEFCMLSNEDDKLNPSPSTCTLCDLDVRNNMFYQQTEVGRGRCILDELTFDQFKYFIASNPNAKDHLFRVTSDPCLRWITERVPLKNTEQYYNDQLQKRMNTKLPYYQIFKSGNFGKGF